jgi:hypothetical protein
MEFLFHFQLLIGVIAQSHWFGRINYCLGGRDNKKADFRHSSKLSAKSVQVISPYTSNASNSHTVLHTMWDRPKTQIYIDIYFLLYQDWKRMANTFPIREIHFSLTRIRRFLYLSETRVWKLGNYFSYPYNLLSKLT